MIATVAMLLTFAGPPPELVVQSGHMAAVSCVAVSPDGARLAACEYRQRRLVLWDLRSRMQLRVVEGAMDFTALAFTPDGRSLAAATAGSTVLLLDGATGAELRTLQGPAMGDAMIVNERNPVAVSAAGLVAGIRVVPGDGAFGSLAIGLWSADGALVATLGGGSSLPTALAFDAAGARLAAAREDGTIEVWDVPKARRLATTKAALAATSLALGAKTLAAVDGRDHVTLFDATTLRGAGKRRADKARLRHVRFDEPGGLLATSDDGLLHRWPATGKAAAIRVGDGAINALAPVPGTGLVALGVGRRVALWDPTRAKPAAVLEGRATTPMDIALVSGGKTLVTAQGRDLRRWDLADGHFSGDLAAASGPVRSLEASPDGAALLVRVDRVAPSLSLVDAVTGTQRWTRAAQVESPVFSPDGRRVAVVLGRTLVAVADARTGEDVMRLTVIADGSQKADARLPRKVFSVGFLPDGRRIATTGTGNAEGDPYVFTVWDLDTARPTVIAGIDEHGPIQRLATPARGSLVAFAYPEYDRTITFNPDARRMGPLLPLNGNTLRYSRDGAMLAVGSKSGRLHVYEASGRKLGEARAGFGGVWSAVFDARGKRLLTSVDDGPVHVWDLPSLKMRAALFFAHRSSLVVTPDGYYAGAREVMPAVGFRIGERAYGFDQLDLSRNRPDKVLEALGSADASAVRLRRDAWEQRVRRYGFTPDQVGDGPQPTVVLEKMPISTASRSVPITVRSDAPVQRLRVSVDGVPVPACSQAVGTACDVPLLPGINRIQVSAIGAHGVESLSETADVTCTAPAVRPNLYVVTVGVSAYRDEAHALEFAAKDARDLAALFERRGRQRFGAVKVLQLVDANATRERILGAGAFLAAARPEDQVVILLAGHGLIDAQARYWFAPVDMDFAHPEARGVGYGDIERLISSVRARRRLVLIDTCQAGEADPAEVAKAAPNVTVRPGARGVTKRAAAPGASAAALLDELFADLRRGNGAAVIAASAAVQVAYELGELKNGVFTRAVLEALDRDEPVTCSELREVVVRRVRELTGGRQVPTARQENVGLDFPVL